jgi:hypothetical protein
VLGVRQVVDRVSLEVFSVICLFSLSSKDPKKQTVAVPQGLRCR